MNALLSLGGWSVIPDLVTKHLLDFLYRNPFLSRLFRLTPAVPGTPQYRKHYGYTFAFVVLGYLLYNMVQSARAMQPNFYQILGASPNADETELKHAFRQFAKRNHPDRPEIGRDGEERFMMVRDAFEALKDPVVRFAYDRFGPDVLLWRKHCTTMREFLRHGLMRSSIYHFVTGIVLLFWSAVGQPSPVSFWRYILFFALFATEMALILSPPSNPTTILNILFPYRNTHQHILFLHQLCLFLSVALTRVAPHLLPDEEMNPNMQQAILERIQSLIAVADRETSLMLHAELNSINHLSSSESSSKGLTTHDPPFARMRPLPRQPTTELLAELAPEMQALIIESNIKQESGPLRSAWDAALMRVSPQPLRKAKEFWEAGGEVTTNGDVEGSGYYVVPSTAGSPPKTAATGGLVPPRMHGESPLARPSPMPPSFYDGSPSRGLDHDLS